MEAKEITTWRDDTALNRFRLISPAGIPADRKTAGHPLLRNDIEDRGAICVVDIHSETEYTFHAVRCIRFLRFIRRTNETKKEIEGSVKTHCRISR